VSEKVARRSACGTATYTNRGAGVVITLPILLRNSTTGGVALITLSRLGLVGIGLHAPVSGSCR
jgi:hypothetical protein